MMFVQYSHTEPPKHTHIHTVLTHKHQEQNNIEVTLRFLCAGQHAKVPSERSQRQYTAEVGWFGEKGGVAQSGLAGRVMRAEPQIPHNALQEQQQSEY